MLELILILVGIVIAFLAFFWAASTYTSRMLATIAAQHGDDTRWLMDTGVAPEGWCRAQRRRIAHLEAEGAPREKVDALKERFRRRLLARLVRHLRYLDRTSLFATEHERHAVTDRIREVGRAWEASTWDQIIGEESFDEPG
jgi:hypothetical protein